MPEHTHRPMPDEMDDPWLVDRLLAHGSSGDSTAAGTALGALLAAATAPATPDELAGEDAVLAAFAQAGAGISPAPSSPRHARRRSMLSTLLAGKAVAAAAAGGIAIAGTAAAAYTGNLPDALQDVAHETIGAPAAQASTERPDAAAEKDEQDKTAEPTGPDASGKAAFGLCTAWEKNGLAMKSVAYEALVKAAGEESKIEEYCESVEHPNSKAADAATDHPTGAPESRPTGAPETRPTGAPETRPTGAPETRPTGAPDTVPTPATGGRPTGK